MPVTRWEQKARQGGIVTLDDLPTDKLQERLNALTRESTEILRILEARRKQKSAAKPLR